MNKKQITKTPTPLAETPAPLESPSEKGSDDDSDFDPQADDSPENRRGGQG